MDTQIRRIKFPVDKSLGSLHLVKVSDPIQWDRLLWSNKLAFGDKKQRIESINIGCAIGQCSVPVKDEYILLLETRYPVMRDPSLLSCLGPNDIDVIEGLTSDEQIAQIAHLTGLIGLPFTGQKTITHACGESLANLTALKYLRLIGTAITGKTLESIGKLTNLEELYLSDRLGPTAIDDEGMNHLCNLNKLRVLNISQSAIADEGIAGISQLPSLESLDISCTKVSDEGLRLLTDLSLKRLSVFGVPITDAGLKVISSISQLEYLGVASEEFGSPGIQALSSLKELKTITFGHSYIKPNYRCKVSYEDILELLTIPSLNSIGLNGVSPPAKDIDRIHHALPAGWKCEFQSAGYVEPNTQLNAQIKRT